jgi:hypothetical protein
VIAEDQAAGVAFTHQVAQLYSDFAPAQPDFFGNGLAYLVQAVTNLFHIGHGVFSV